MNALGSRLFQYALMAACSYEATRCYENEEENILPPILSGFLLGVAVFNQIQRRSHHYERIADPKKLCVLSVMGIAAAMISADSKSAGFREDNPIDVDRAAMERDIFFRRGVQCAEDLYAHRRLFTKQECTVCVHDEFSIIFGAREMYQKRFDFNVNQLICISSIPYFHNLWPQLTNLTLNTTNGQWPCGAPKADENDATRKILQYYAKLHAPMSVTLLPVNDSCYRVVGQGTRSLHMTTLCIKPFLLNYLDSPVTDCVTDAFREYMIEYASEFSFPKVL